MDHASCRVMASEGMPPRPRSSGLRRRDGTPAASGASSLGCGLACERDDDRADECEAEADHGDDDVPAPVG